jgi:hypothetical protein
MKFRLYREYGAGNSGPVFDAVEAGLRSLGHEIVTNGEDIPVIWSVLWSGRMLANKQIYHSCRSQNKNIMIVEVGNLYRNKTWRVSLNHINNLGEFANNSDLDPTRPKKLKIKLEDLKINRRPEIMIATQHQQSLQWEGLQSINEWLSQTVSNIRQYTDRKIVVRPHPRSPIKAVISGVDIITPNRIPGSYDDFDINYDFHCVVNYNSGPAVQAAIKGTPIICDQSSLAGPLSGKMSEIENISLPDREEWFLKLCHTEWTVDEISTGIPLARLISKII